MSSKEPNAKQGVASSVIVSLNPDGVVTAKPYHDDIKVDNKTEVKTKLMENIGYQNDQEKNNHSGSSCNSSTVELTHVQKRSERHLCDAERCNKSASGSVPSPWHGLKTVFLSVLIVLFLLWIVMLILLINKNAL
ncbi:hypothetical protein WDU94_013417 [Cyamophila willieti]